MLDGTLWIFLSEALVLPTGLLTAAFLTRRLGPEGYGLLTLASVLVAWMARLCFNDRAKAIGRNAMRLIIGLVPFAGMTARASPEIVKLIFGPEFLPLLSFMIGLTFLVLGEFSRSEMYQMRTMLGWQPGQTHKP